ncbi:MAG TPA: carbohydrate ABC transporter permease [Clostridiaceae bacterium]|nr:carbohydrate ABC transporter permease [Clostridiaceae bacterium]
MIRNKISKAAIYFVFIIYALYALYPVIIMILTSFKSNLDIIKYPLSLPKSLYLDGYKNAWVKGQFSTYFVNSIIIAFFSLIAIIILSLMASYGFARYRFKMSSLLYLYFLAGIMIPIKLGSANLFRMMRSLNLIDRLTSVILVNIAMSIPISILILTSFIKQIPDSLEEAAKIDGCKSSKILWWIVVPIVRPAIATVTIMNFLPIWNDFYFPLLFIRKENLKPIPLGIAQFFGEYQTDWSIIFAGLTIASLPTMAVYLFMSKQFIQGLTAGAIKG